MTDHEHVVHLVEADCYPPDPDGDGDEVWWMDHYVCSCGWESHDSHTDLPDGGFELAARHVLNVGGVVVRR